MVIWTSAVILMLACVAAPAGAAHAQAVRSTTASPGHSTPVSAESAAKLVLNALNKQDWAALYRITASSLRQGQSQAQFELVFKDSWKTTWPRLVKIALAGRGKTSQAAGVGTIFTQPCNAQMRDARGRLTTIRTSVYLLLEKRQWRFFGADFLKVA